MAGSGIAAAEGRAEAETAIDILRQAVAMGIRDFNWFRTDALLDPLRGRDDFRMLLMDLALPANPFAGPPDERAVVSLKP